MSNIIKRLQHLMDVIGSNTNEDPQNNDFRQKRKFSPSKRSNSSKSSKKSRESVTTKKSKDNNLDNLNVHEKDFQIFLKNRELIRNLAHIQMKSSFRKWKGRLARNNKIKYHQINPAEMYRFKFHPENPSVKNDQKFSKITKTTETSQTESKNIKSFSSLSSKQPVQSTSSQNDKKFIYPQTGKSRAQNILITKAYSRIGQSSSDSSSTDSSDFETYRSKFLDKNPRKASLQLQKNENHSTFDNDETEIPPTITSSTKSKVPMKFPMKFNLSDSSDDDSDFDLNKKPYKPNYNYKKPFLYSQNSKYLQNAEEQQLIEKQQEKSNYSLSNEKFKPNSIKTDFKSPINTKPPSPLRISPKPISIHIENSSDSTSSDISKSKTTKVTDTI